MDNVLLEHIMADHPIKVKDNVPVGVVSHLLLRYRINGILIVKADDETKLVGVITTTDLLNLIDKALNKGTQRIRELKRISALPVGKITSKKVITLQKNDSVLKAIALMHHKNIHTLPIFDKEKLVGVVGKHDILNIALS